MLRHWAKCFKVTKRKAEYLVSRCLNLFRGDYICVYKISIVYTSYTYSIYLSVALGTMVKTVKQCPLNDRQLSAIGILRKEGQL